MRVLFVNDYAFEGGGAERLLASERRELESRGHRTELFSLDSTDLYGPASEWTVPCQNPKGRIGTTVGQLWHPTVRIAFEKAVARFDPELIHYHNLTRLSAVVLAEAERFPAVLTLHDYGVMYPLLKRRFPDGRFCDVGGFPCCIKHAGVVRYLFERIRTRIHRRRMQTLRFVLAPSGYVQSVAIACGIPRVMRCLNGVADERRVVGARRRPAQILYAGRYEREKGVFALLSAFELVADRLSFAELAFAGGGIEGDRLRACARASRHSDKVSFLGQLSHEELASWYARCSVVAVPSLWPEPFGLVGVEAMFAGTPVVGSGRGGMTEWLEDGRNGLIADPGPATFSSALARILTDETLYARLSQACRATARRFEISEHVDNLEKIYNAAIA
ncbi:MAG: glycosyltransferase [Solirubrobacteraceae bacterium]